MSNLILITLMSFGIIAGSKATTDGYVYLGHNEDIPGEKMLNIYNVLLMSFALSSTFLSLHDVNDRAPVVRAATANPKIFFLIS